MTNSVRLRGPLDTPHWLGDMREQLVTHYGFGHRNCLGYTMDTTAGGVPTASGYTAKAIDQEGRAAYDPGVKMKVYLETTVVSYLTALPARDLVRTAHQQLTFEWWRTRDRFDLFVSEAVLQERCRRQRSGRA